MGHLAVGQSSGWKPKGVPEDVSAVYGKVEETLVQSGGRRPLLWVVKVLWNPHLQSWGSRKCTQQNRWPRDVQAVELRKVSHGMGQGDENQDYLGLKGWDEDPATFLCAHSDFFHSYSDIIQQRFEVTF